jgi:hypothetical protein
MLKNSRRSSKSFSNIPPAKARRTPSSENYFIHFLCGLCVFARDIASFGCGCAALREFFSIAVQRSEYFLIKNPLLCAPERLRGEFSPKLQAPANAGFLLRVCCFPCYKLFVE